MEKNTGKVREFCQPGKVGTLFFLEYSFLCNGSFTPEIYYAIAITIMFKNGLCAHFCDFDCDSYLTHRKSPVRNRTRVILLRCELTLA